MLDFEGTTREKVGRVELRMIIGICGHTRKDKIQNECVWREIGAISTKKNNIKSIKVVWSLLRRVQWRCTTKASEGTNMRSRLYDFLVLERGNEDQEQEEVFEEVLKRNLVVNK